MKTVYVDIYFLINFCVDVIALAIALYVMKIKCGIKRLVLSVQACREQALPGM